MALLTQKNRRRTAAESVKAGGFGELRAEILSETLLQFYLEI